VGELFTGEETYGTPLVAAAMQQGSNTKLHYEKTQTALENKPNCVRKKPNCIRKKETPNNIRKKGDERTNEQTDRQTDGHSG